MHYKGTSIIRGNPLERQWLWLGLECQMIARSTKDGCKGHAHERSRSWSRWNISLPSYKVLPVIPTCLPTCLPVYLPTCLPAYLPTCLHWPCTCTHARIHTSHAYVDTCALNCPEVACFHVHASKCMLRCYHQHYHVYYYYHDTKHNIST